MRPQGPPEGRTAPLLPGRGEKGEGMSSYSFFKESIDEVWEPLADVLREGKEQEATLKA